MGQTAIRLTPTETRRFDVDRPKDWKPSIRSQEEVDDLWWDRLLNKGQRAANTALDFFTGSTPQEEAEIGLESLINPMAVLAPRFLRGASKAVTRRGDPTSLYHGTRSRGFEPTPNNPLGEFDLDLASPSSSQGRGVYLTDEQAYASAIGGGKPRLGLERSTHPGSLYEVGLDASPEELIDLDRYLAEQTPEVQKALREVFDSLQGQKGPYGITGGYDYGEPYHSRLTRALRLEPPGNQAPNRHGGITMFEAPSYALQNRETQALRELGVPGALSKRPVSGGSQGMPQYGGEKVHDYVIWDPDRLNILRKLFTGVGAVGAASQLTED
jgi:hypothetical protein